jgi:hypothetical protein
MLKNEYGVLYIEFTYPTMYNDLVIYTKDKGKPTYEYVLIGEQKWHIMHIKHSDEMVLGTFNNRRKIFKEKDSEIIHKVNYSTGILVKVITYEEERENNKKNTLRPPVYAKLVRNLNNNKDEWVVPVNEITAKYEKEEVYFTLRYNKEKSGLEIFK